ncbi:MAG TPA: dTDP-4-dehydrorhamnose reductase [Bacteroidales bacterium]|nr:dTDP-4-dehydrorhamnose reductase [Bacteroidales bacterium]
MINVLVTGANGQLGSELKHIHNKGIVKFDRSVNFVFTDIDTLDISNPIFLKKFFQDHSFDFVINCAAYTNVDLAETEKEKAYNVNATCVKNIVEAIKERNLSLTKFIHISTDYVFDGKSHIPYTEEMQTNPKSVYGKSKLEGEIFALQYKNSMVIRTSWLYSSYGKNFAKTIHKLCNERESLNVVFDQIGTPTYAYDLAYAIFQIVKQSVSENRFISGIYHFSNEGVCSWYDFAKLIANKAKSNCVVNPIESKDYPTPVARPFYSVLNKNKIKSNYKLVIPFWQDSLDEYFNITDNK